MHFACRSFIGKHSDFNWSQYWENEPDDPIVISQKGHLFGLINFTLDYGSSDISNTGKDTIQKLNNFYFSQTGDISDSLKKTLDFFKNEFASQFVQSTVVFCVIHQKKAYFATYNTGHIVIQRQDKISQLISGQENNIETLSGPVLSGDKILLCTDDFYQKISFIKIKLALAENYIQTIEEIFLSELYTLHNQPNMAGALIEIHFDDTENNSLNQESDLAGQEIISSVASTVKAEKPNNPSFIKKIFLKKDTYVSSREVSPIVKRKKINLLIGIVLIVGLGVSFYFGYKKNQERKIEAEYQSLKIELNKKISDSIAVKSINLDNALQSAKEADKILEKLQGLKVHVTEVQILKKQVDGLLTQTGSVPTANSHDVFLDLKNVFKDNQYSHLLYTKNEIILVDSVVGSIDSVDTLTNKTKNILKSPLIKDITKIVNNNGSIYFLSGNMLYLINKETADLKIDFNKTDSTIADISFWNGILYALDSSNSKIYKFTPSGSSFDAGSSWLKEGNTISQNTVSLSINGSIWLISEQGEVSSFTRGIKDKTNFSSTTQPASGMKIITTVDLGVIVIQDKDNYIYLYKNTGELNSKYNFSDKKVSDITVAEKDNFVYILADDQKIYKVSL